MNRLYKGKEEWHLETEGASEVAHGGRRGLLPRIDGRDETGEEKDKDSDRGRGRELDFFKDFS